MAAKRGRGIGSFGQAFTPLGVSGGYRVFVGIVALTLRPRSTSLTLADRATDLALAGRAVGLTLPDRATGLTLAGRVIDLTVDDR